MRIQEKAAVVITALMLTLISPTTYAQEKESDGWEFKLTPYVWAVGLDGDMVVKGTPIELDLDFDELLDDVEFAGQVHFGAKKGDWSFIVDSTIVQIETEVQSGPAIVNTELDYVLTELLAGYRIAPQWDLLGGVRYWFMDVDLDIQGTGPFGNSGEIDEDEEWGDLIVGGRFFADISEKWSFIGKADVGGFDIGKSADSTWSATALFFYDKSPNTQLIAGWRIIDVDFDDGSGLSRFVFDVEQSGPVFGVNFKWPRQ